MAGKRSPDKAFVGWWPPVKLRDRLKAFTQAWGATDTDVLNRALSEWLDRNEHEEHRDS